MQLKNNCTNNIQVIARGEADWNFDCYEYNCDWLWENPPVTHKYKYLEIHNSIIQSIISRESLKLHAYNLLQICSYLIAIRLPTLYAQLTDFPAILDCILSTPQALI